MTKQAKTIRNPFFFSRAGTKTISSFTAAAAIADDCCNKIPAKRSSKVSPLMCFYHQAAHFSL